MPGILSANVRLGFLEVRQHLGEGPPRTTGGAPGVVLARVTARVDHAVDADRAPRPRPAANRNVLSFSAGTFSVAKPQLYCG